MPASTPPAYIPVAIPPGYKAYYLQEGAIPYGSSQKWPIGPDGSLKGIWITFEGSVTTAADDVTLLDTGGQPFNLISNVIVNVGGIGQTIILAGELLYEINKAMANSWTIPQVYPPGEVADSGTAVPVSFSLYCPICVRDPELYGNPGDYLGLVYTGDKTVQVTVQIQTNDPSTAWTGASGNFTTADTTGNFNITSMKIDTPNPAQDPTLLAAVSWYHALQEDTDAAISAQGNQTYQPAVQQTRIYLRLLTALREGFVWKGGVLGTIGAQIQGILTLLEPLDETSYSAIEAARYGSPAGESEQVGAETAQLSALSPGVHVIDFDVSKTRDQWLAVDSISEFTVTETMLSGDANVWQTVAQYLQPSPNAQKWISQASPEVLQEAEAA